MSQLVWPPVYRALEDRFTAEDALILILVPFAKLAALKKLRSAHPNTDSLKIVCRWRPEDLLAGVSDIEIFTYLKDAGCQLFINPDIHLKLYIFASNNAFSTSGNLTLRGLGYGAIANIEVGTMVSLSAHDWSEIYGVINKSRQVDEALYQRYKVFIKQHPQTVAPTPFPGLLASAKTYTISSLPATESPIWLADFYANHNPADFTPEQVRRASHDLVTFGISPGLSQVEFHTQLGQSFCKSPFVTDFVALLKTERSLRFGAVNDWIHQKCEDVPLPYRWEIKENTAMFYDWLAHFISEISWDRPRHSQVIYWQKPING